MGRRQQVLPQPHTDLGVFVSSLFRRFAVEVFVVGLRVGTGVVDDAVPMIWRRIESIELKWNAAVIDDVMFGPSRDDHREASSDRCPNAIENRLTGSPPPRGRTGRACGLPPRSLPWASNAMTTS